MGDVDEIDGKREKGRPGISEVKKVTLRDWAGSRDISEPGRGTDLNRGDLEFTILRIGVPAHRTKGRRRLHPAESCKSILSCQINRLRRHGVLVLKVNEGFSFLDSRRLRC